jgi:hypothetical protein
MNYKKSFNRLLKLMKSKQEEARAGLVAEAAKDEPNFKRMARLSAEASTAAFVIGYIESATTEKSAEGLAALIKSDYGVRPQVKTAPKPRNDRKTDFS